MLMTPTGRSEVWRGRLLELHATACDAGVADPVRLAGWMVRFWFVDQDLFEVDPVRYQKALGREGVDGYRKAVAARGHEDTFAVRYARERLAVLDGDSDRIVALVGGDLTRPHQFVQAAEAMAELGPEDKRDDTRIAPNPGRRPARRA